MSAMRDDNRRLNTTVSELRADRRSQDRKLRDLQHQLDKLRATPSIFIGNNALQLEQVGLEEAEAVKRWRLAAVIVQPVGT